MSCAHALNEWSHRRYRPFKTWHQHSVTYGVGVPGDASAVLKGVCTGWRRKWPYALVMVQMTDPAAALCYWPGYSFDDGQTFRCTIRRVRTQYFAFQVGPDPVMFSVFGARGNKIKVSMSHVGTGLTWIQVLRACDDLPQVTFV